MARKLIFDRTIWLVREQTSRVVVPKDELWKVGYVSGNNDGIRATESYFQSAYSWDRAIAGGATVEMRERAALCGIAFKVVEE